MSNVIKVTAVQKNILKYPMVGSMFHLKKFVGKWISFAVLTHFGNYQVAVAAHVVLFLNPFQPSVAFHIKLVI